MYGPKLLKECELQRKQQTTTFTAMERGKNDDKSITMEDVSDVAFRIVEAMVFYTAHGQQFQRQQDKHLELGPKQVVRVEDLLQIFVDHHDLLTDFLKRILTEFSGARFNDLERLTQIKLYNRLLECYLVKKQRIDAEIERERQRDRMYTTETRLLDEML